jgi:thioredoxin 1
MTKPIEVSDAQFDSEILKAEKPVLVDFWAPWCGPCRMVGPVVEELAGEYQDRLKVAKVNTDDNQSHAARLGIQGIPTLIFFKDGREVDRVVGALPKGALKQRIDAVLESVAAVS